jgi:hypothetical protein
MSVRKRILPDGHRLEVDARESAARIAGELAAFRTLQWWRRLSLPPSAQVS